MRIFNKVLLQYIQMAAHFSTVNSSQELLPISFFFEHFEQLFLHLQEYAFDISSRQLFEVRIKQVKALKLGLLCLQFILIHGT